jgi:hypothetical protein
MAQKKGISKAKVGAGLAASAAAAALAGYYFYADKNAARHRKMAARWAGALKKDVVKEMSSLKKIDQASIRRAVDKVSKFYQESGEAKRADVLKAARELKDHWDHLKKEVSGTVRAVSGAKKPAKRSSRK